MSEENETYCIWGVVVVLITAMVLATIAAGCREAEQTTQAAIKAGLVQKPIGNNWYWAKPEDSK